MRAATWNKLKAMQENWPNDLFNHRLAGCAFALFTDIQAEKAMATIETFREKDKAEAERKSND